MRRLTLSVAALLMPLFASAQYTVGEYFDDNVVMHFADTPRDVQALGMGGATVLQSSPASGAFSNPAATPFMKGTSAVAISYGQVDRRLSTATHSVAVGFAYCFDSRVGVDFGIGMEPSVNSTTAVGDNGAMSGQSSQPSSLLLGLGVSYRPLDFLSIGANVRYMNQGLMGETIGAFCTDVFAMASKYGASAAFGVRNLGTVFGSDYELPALAVLALGYEVEFGKHGLSATVEGDAYMYASKALAVCGGLSYTFGGMVSARFGGHYGPESPLGNYLTAGLGLAVSVVGVDLAYVFGEEPFADSFRVGLIFKF